MKTKNTYLFILLIGLAVNVNAQIPNGGFENWTMQGSFYTPDNWGTTIAYTSASGIVTCTKGTPGNPGVSYLKLISKNISGFGVVPGIAVSGTLSTPSLQVTSGFPYNDRPDKLAGKWQYMASGADQGFIAFYLTKWNTVLNVRDTIASVYSQLPGMVMSWHSFSIPLNYFSSEIPDSAAIILSASGTTPVSNSYLYIDSLALVKNTTGINELNGEKLFSVFPIPSSGDITVQLHHPLHGSISWKLLDLSGRTIQEEINQPLSHTENESFLISGIPEGFYFLQIVNRNKRWVSKILIR